MESLGNRVYGAAGMALGVIGLVWGDFATVWQPVPPGTPGYTALAYFAAALSILGGIAMQFRRTAASGALVLAALYAVFSLFWGWRVVQFPQIFGTWLGFAEQLALVIGGLVAALIALHDDTHPGRARAGRLAFGVCLLAFGAAHLIYVKETAAMVPAWLPPQQNVWAIATGVADLLAGLAFLSGVMALLASRLVVLMFAGFGALVWAPKLFAASPDHIAWGGNAINLALVGAAWVLADSIARARHA